MNVSRKWEFGALASVAIALAATLVVVDTRHQSARGAFHPASSPEAAPPVPVAAPAQADEPVKLIVAFSRPLLKYTTQHDPAAVLRILFESEVRTPSGKRVEFVPVAMTSRDMVDGVLNGSLKAHIIIPCSEVYLELADREWSMRTGKPITSDKLTFTQQPCVLAVRRPMAEALGWPKKDIGWADVVGIAQDGWKSVGHPEWGSLRLVLSNPNLADSGVHSVVSIALGILGKSKGLTPDDLAGPGLTAAIKALDHAVVWYPSGIEEFVRNEAFGVPPRCHMTFVPEHVMLTLNDRSIRRKSPPEWVAIYPAKGTILDNITGAVVRREWVTEEQRAAAVHTLGLLKAPDVQKRLMAVGHRSVLAGQALPASLTDAMGVDPKRLREAIEMPPVEVILDCLSSWNREWKTRYAESAAKVTPGNTVPSVSASMKVQSQLSPTVQCVHRARPSAIAIRRGDSKDVSGSGVVVDARGYAVTNSHVVAKEKVVTVSFIGAEEKVYKGTVEWVDTSQDLAIIRILIPGKYPAIPYADASPREVGESVVAIGNPLGYTGTVTVGIISALDREITLPSGAVLPKVIQTDAGINPGNSGGPLLNLDGELIGIVFAVRSGAQNIAFAIPVDRVRAYVQKCLAE